MCVPVKRFYGLMIQIVDKSYSDKELQKSFYHILSSRSRSHGQASDHVRDHCVDRFMLNGIKGSRVLRTG